MSWTTDHRHNQAEDAVCTSQHFELRCETCDVRRMSRLSLDAVQSQYHQGRLTQEDYEAYSYVHWLLSPYRGTPTAPEHPQVRRIARKLLRARSFDVPEELSGRA